MEKQYREEFEKLWKREFESKPIDEDHYATWLNAIIWYQSQQPTAKKVVTVKEIDDILIMLIELFDSSDGYKGSLRLKTAQAIATLYDAPEHTMQGEECDHERAVKARMAYEINCLRKYDRDGRPSLPIPKNERMGAYAIKYNTTEKEMMDCELEADRRISKLLSTHSEVKECDGPHCQECELMCPNQSEKKVDAPDDEGKEESLKLIYDHVFEMYVKEYNRHPETGEYCECEWNEAKELVDDILTKYFNK